MSEAYSFSTDEEHYDGPYPTREAALAAGRKENPDGYVYTGRNVPCDFLEAFRDALEPEDLLRRAEEIGSENEWGWAWYEDSVFSRKKTDIDALRDLLVSAVEVWLKRPGVHPGLWTVVEVQEHAPEPAAVAE